MGAGKGRRPFPAGAVWPGGQLARFIGEGQKCAGQRKEQQGLFSSTRFVVRPVIGCDGHAFFIGFEYRGGIPNPAIPNNAVVRG